jgi:hypothetical protein
MAGQMPLSFPLKLKGALWPPEKGRCGMCGGSLGASVVYLTAGAAADLEASTLVDQEAFWNCGIHTSNSDGLGNRDVTIVHALNQDQFDLSFCSTGCLKEFFLTIVREGESQDS